MLVEWFNLLERFVVAVEKIAELKTVTPDTIPAKFTGDAVPASFPVSTAPETVKSQADQDAKPLERELIKKELRDLGVAFSASAKTESLKKLLDGARQSKPAPDQDAGRTPGPTPVITATRDQARDALIAVSAKFGKDTGLEILRKEGMADKLSEVDPGRYAFIVDACTRKEAQLNG